MTWLDAILARDWAADLVITAILCGVFLSLRWIGTSRIRAKTAVLSDEQRRHLWLPL